GREGVPLRQATRQLLEIVDLAVEHAGDRPQLVPYGLVPTGEIDDGEARVEESQPWFAEPSDPVRTPGRDPREHAVQRGRDRGDVATRSDDACEPAHVRRSRACRGPRGAALSGPCAYVVVVPSMPRRAPA